MLMGSNEVPTNNSTAMGTATLKFNNTTKVFTIVTHDLSSITGGHIHKGTAGHFATLRIPAGPHTLHS
jgi:hypothetical protein